MSNSSTTATDSADATAAAVDGMPRNQSRFKVNKVEGEEEEERRPPLAVADDDGEPRPKQVQFVVSVEDVDDADQMRTTQGGGGGGGGEATVNYKTSNFKSFRNIETVERVPIVDYYRDVMSLEGAMAKRPSLSQLHEEHYGNDRREMEGFKLLDSGVPAKSEKVETTGLRLGWVQGVLVRVVLSILGAILFLRISWMTAYAGIGLSLVIVLIATGVAVLTSLSMCAICTNGEIKGGGAYYMISRSLGPEFGGSIGLVFAFANVVSAAFCVVGFSETLRDLLKEHGVVLIDGALNDIRAIGFLTSVLLLSIVVVGVSFESKAQWVMLVILTVSLVDFVVGTFLPPNNYQTARGVTGYSLDNLVTNFWPDFRQETFFTVFAVFYPATTGIMAGANISGDLDNPTVAIPKGTLIGVAITSGIYVATLVITGATMVRDASGDPSDLVNGSISSCTVNGTCEYGLCNYFQTLELLGAWGPLVTAGIFAATLSSSLAGYVSGPKLLQALGKDKLFPGIDWFAVPYGKNGEPRRAYLAAFLFGLTIVAIGDINVIAPIIANIFLCCYALMNYAVFDASFSGSPGFRPSFRYYNQWVALFSALVCVVIMFVLSWWVALITFCLCGALYVYIDKRKPDVNWGTSGQANCYKNALQSALKLASTEEHVKNYRPQLLVLTGNPVSRPSLVDFGGSVAKDVCLFICGQVVLTSMPYRHQRMQTLMQEIYKWFEKRKIRSFYTIITAETLHVGVRCMLQSVGVGKLRPNVVLMGFKCDWQKCSPDQVLDYFNIIHSVFDNYCGLAILRVDNGLDLSDRIAKCEPSAVEVNSAKRGQNIRPSASSQLIKRPSSEGHSVDMMREDSYMTYGNKEEGAMASVAVEETEKVLEYLTDEGQPSASNGGSQSTTTDSFIPKLFEGHKGRHLSRDERQLMYDINRFHLKVKNATIDVYWLFDDGGLGLLIPYLLIQPQSYLRGAKLRIFTVATSRSQLEREQRSMAALLSRFRLDYSDVIVIPDLTKKPSDAVIADFEHFIEPCRLQPPTSDDSSDDRSSSSTMFISATEYETLKPKTYRQLRIKEIIEQHSTEAELVVLTLPIPRKNVISASLYLSWLDFVSKDIRCPVLFLRGNQESVLTFYS